LLVLFLSCTESTDNAITGSGTLEAREVLVSAKQNGQILQLLVNEGDAVTTGQLIAQLDMEKYSIQRRQTTAGLDELRLNMENAQRAAASAHDLLQNTEKKYLRTQALLAEGSVTQQQFDDIETAFKTAQNQYDSAETTVHSLRAKGQQVQAQIDLLDSQIADGQITSPLSGTVLETFAEQGEMARIGSPIVNIADIERMWIKIYLKDAHLGQIRLGDQAQLSISSFPNQPFIGKLTWISSQAEFTPKNIQTKEARADLVYAVKIEVHNPDGRLKIGMPADVQLSPF
ncbi:MAG: HlyD family efflux transporter periplasmic adaptor subunit, partial [Calditrichaeota bacterium]